MQHIHYYMYNHYHHIVIIPTLYRLLVGKEGCKGYGNALMFPIYMIGSVLLEKSGVLHYGQNKSIRKLRSSSLVMSKDSFSSHSDGQEKRQLTI